MSSLVDERGYNQGYQWTPTQEIRMRRRADAILDAVHGDPNDRVLEVGCGTGELAHFLARDGRARVTGVDLSTAFIEQATKSFATERLDFMTADLAKPEDVRALGQGFQAIVGNGILHHLHPQIDTALTAFKQLLLPGGRFVFWEPNLFNPYVFAIFSFGALRKAAKLEPDEMAFTPTWISRHLLAAGFTSIEVRYRDFLVPIVPLHLVSAVTAVGDIVERLPIVSRLAQSLFITATRGS